MAMTSAALSASQAQFEFEVGRYTSGELMVLCFELEEELSRPYSLDVTLVARPEVEVDAEALVGEKALLSIHHGDGSARLLHGLVTRVEAWEEGRGDTRNRFRLRVAPALWRLGEKRRCRIYQDMRTPEIVKQILDEGGR